MLSLDAPDPFEESATVRSYPWPVTSSGASKAVPGGGNVFALPTISLVAAGNVTNPSFSDGTRTLTSWGTVGNGKTLVFDGPAGVVRLDGQDVTPYTTGLFPRIAPGGTTLTFADDASSSHTAAVVVTVRDRWW